MPPNPLQGECHSAVNRQESSGKAEGLSQRRLPPLGACNLLRPFQKPGGRSLATPKLRSSAIPAWPNCFRQARFLSAVDMVQADRFRRKVAEEMARLFSEVDLLLVPSLRDEMLVITNFTGHPSLTLRAGFVQVSEARSDWAPDLAHPLPRFSPPRRVPHGVTLIGRLFEEATLATAGLALEREFAVAGERPPGFY